MKAMILAAGLGTRLKPYTDNKPKALVEINGRPLLDLVLETVIQAGFNEIIVNVHHFADQVVDHLKANTYGEAILHISDESDLLLDTGGALMKAKWFLDGNEPFLVHNVDIISSLNLKEFLKAHLHKNPLATLAVSDRKTSRYFLFDQDLRLRGWENLSSGERVLRNDAPGHLQRLAFSGIHMISPDIFTHLDQSGRFSIVPAYLELANTCPIYGYPHDPKNWFDLGKMENFPGAAEFLRSQS